MWSRCKATRRQSAQTRSTRDSVPNVRKRSHGYWNRMACRRPTSHLQPVWASAIRSPRTRQKRGRRKIVAPSSRCCRTRGSPPNNIHGVSTPSERVCPDESGRRARRVYAPALLQAFVTGLTAGRGQPGEPARALRRFTRWAAFLTCLTVGLISCRSCPDFGSGVWLHMARLEGVDGRQENVYSADASRRPARHRRGGDRGPRFMPRTRRPDQRSTGSSAGHSDGANDWDDPTDRDDWNNRHDWIGRYARNGRGNLTDADWRTVYGTADDL